MALSAKAQWIKGRGRKKGQPFVQLPRYIKRSQAWHDLSLAARCALIELIDRHSGINNGMIGLGVRELAAALRSSKDTASSALVELDNSGLARPVTGGHWKGKRATERRLTWIVCAKTGELPIRSWAPYQVSDLKDTEGRPEGHKAFKCPARGTHSRKNPISDPSKCPATGTHIDIYQGDTLQEIVPSADIRSRQLQPDPSKSLRGWEWD
jgi:hypothetical protein